MKFLLVHTEVPLLNFNKLERSEESRGMEANVASVYKLALNVFPDSKRKNMFAVLFDVEMLQPEEFNLKLHFVAWFESPQHLEDAEVNSPFARINAPAIAFPYLRSFVSLLTLNAGFKPAILSPVNFVKVYEELESAKG